jgi:hypothetical protein
MTEPAISPLEISKMVDKLKDAAADCFEDKNYDGAIDYLLAGIKLDPYNHVLWYNISQLYNKKGELHFCLHALHKSLEALPSYDLAIEGIEIIEKKIARRYSMGLYK